MKKGEKTVILFAPLYNEDMHDSDYMVLHEQK